MIVASILVHNVEDLKERLDSIKGLVEEIQYDICDNTLVPNTTLPLDKAIPIIKRYNFRVSAHLMVEDPTSYIKKYGKDFNRVIVHIESNDAMDAIRLANEKIETSIAIIAGSETENLAQYKQLTSNALVLALDKPGFSGEKFSKKAIPLITSLKDAKFKVEVDGGVNLKTIGAIVKAGATKFDCASAIFNGNPKENIKKLQDEINKNS